MGRKCRLGVEALEGREVPATFFVTTTADVVNSGDGVLSLREAINRANANPGADTIALPPGQFNQTLAGADNTNVGGDFDVTDSVTITGITSTATVINGNHRERLFDVLGPVTVKFSNLALKHGGEPLSNGGAVQALSANIVLDHVEAVDNVGRIGGVINAEGGAVTVLSSQLHDNAGGHEGGAIRTGSGRILVDLSTIKDNHALKGGGIFAQSGAVTVARTTVTGNRSLFSGGGIDSEGGVVNLSNAIIKTNTTDGDGGGVFGRGEVRANKSLLTDNHAPNGSGGAVNGTTSVFLNRSTVSNNTSHLFGGGVCTVVASLSSSTMDGNTTDGDGGGISAERLAAATGSTISNNTAGHDGGGILGGQVALTNSTVSGNTAHHFSGGIRALTGGNLVNATIASNHADVFGGAGGVENAGGVMRVRNTIIANNSVADGDDTANSLGQDVLGLFDSLGHNLVRDANSGNANTDFTDPLNLDIVGVDPLLGALGNNGGPTRTMALLPGSPAIDHGSNLSAPLTDQRGVARPRDGDHNGSLIVDIGAFEL
jgi:predicted outer membrane repeat protein